MSAARNVTLCCADDDEPTLAPSIAVFNSEGLHPEVLAGIAENPRSLGDAMDASDGPGVYVIFESELMDRSRVRQVEGLFSARRGPGDRLIVARLQDAPGLLIKKIRGAAAAGSLEAATPQPDRPITALRDVIPMTSVSALADEDFPLDKAFGADLRPSEPLMPTPDAGPELRSEMGERGRAVSEAGAVPIVARGVPSLPARRPPPEVERISLASPPPRRVSRRPWWIGGSLVVGGAVAWLISMQLDLGGMNQAASREVIPVAGAKIGASGKVDPGSAAAGQGSLGARPSSGAPAEPAPEGEAQGAIGAVPVGGGTQVAAENAPTAATEVERSAESGAEARAGIEPGAESAAAAEPDSPVEMGSGAMADDDAEMLKIARAIRDGRLHALNDLLYRVPDETQTSWADAASYCRSHPFGGVSGFSLPTLKELKRLRRARQLESGRYWSTSLDISKGEGNDHILVVETGGAGPGAVPKSELARRVCVRAR